MTDKTHAQAPQISGEVFGALAQVAEGHPEASMVVVFDPVMNATLIARARTGVVESWNVIAPMSEDATRAILAEEVTAGRTTEDEIVFLKMAEVAPENARLN